MKLEVSSYKLVVGWLYPELMSTYGDRGNIICLTKRCEWRGIDVEIKRLDIGFKIDDLKSCDLLFMGGAQDRQQAIVAKDLKQKSNELREMVEDGIPGLYICGAYQFLGKHYKEADGTVIDGLGILDLYTENPGINIDRLTGNVVVKLNSESVKQLISKNTNQLINQSTDQLIVGFENHGGRTYLGAGVMPLGTVVVGQGNNGKDKTEGAVYKNSFGSYFHGPILPKNPHFADLLIRLALEKKYGNADLKSLEDGLEWEAHKVVANKLGVSYNFPK